jgi:hypothetical protein
MFYIEVEVNGVELTGRTVGTNGKKYLLSPSWKLLTEVVCNKRIQQSSLNSM